VSLYLDLDPSVAPTAGDVQTRVSSLLGEAERRLEEGRNRLDHEARAAVRGDLDRIGRWLRTDFDRDGVRGLAIFADGLDNFWSTIETGEPVVDDVMIADELYLAPLTAIVGRGDGALVAMVGRERGRVSRLESGRLVAIADDTEDVPSRHDQGGWSQANYERHIETLVDRHLRRVAATLDRCFRGMRGAPIVLVGADEVRSEFEALLAHETRACVVGWTAVEAHADEQRLLAAIRPVLDRWWNGREEATLDRWREEAAKNGRAAAGWEETLEAASDGRVDLLLVQSGIDHAAYECPKCGRAQLTDGSCPIDGTAMESRDAGLDVAVHKTLVNGGTVQVIREHRDLEPVGGLAALLRY
jgi:peptide chain release factor subunit 1